MHASLVIKFCPSQFFSSNWVLRSSAEQPSLQFSRRNTGAVVTLSLSPSFCPRNPFCSADPSPSFLLLVILISPGIMKLSANINQSYIVTASVTTCDGFVTGQH